MVMRKIADNYKVRAKTILKRLLAGIEILLEAERQPTEEELEKFIPKFHHILNWSAEPYRKRGIPMPYYLGPLTEEEMKAVEDRISSIHTTIIKDDKLGYNIGIHKLKTKKEKKGRRKRGKWRRKGNIKD